MTTDFFEKYMHIVQLKYDLHASSEPEWNDWKKYSNGIIDEIAEITEEVKENNAIYLEDELGDILRDYMNLLHVLEQAGKIDSMQSVFARSLKKYGQRIEAIDQGGKIDLHSSHRDRVKKIQKEENKEEHERRYQNKPFTIEPIADLYTLPFAPWLIEQIREKSKWKTYRFGMKYDYLQIGDEIRVTQVDTGEYIGPARVVSKVYTKFGDIPLDSTGHEVYMDREAMREKFNGYYAYIGRPITDKDDFLVIGFELLSE